ncbi:GNAT family N-acetyltransferase [Nesterenkonia sp. F]|uniref:GNAT family N-acetyltransferase n=1 Tax=Nesterenkonia sp. F TaxID=795955 RepID=UPI000A06C91C|nr:GNAT family protein [Nesterenkonia sp. F]
MPAAPPSAPASDARGPSPFDGDALRPLRRADAEAVRRAFAADPQMARQGDVDDLESARAYVLHVTDASRGRHAAAVDVDGAAVGVVGLRVTAEDRRGWLFYWVRPEHRGCGLASAAAATTAHHALSTAADEAARPTTAPVLRAGGPVTGLERLELGHRADNPASGVVARAAGFVREGLERGKFLVDGERVDVVTYGRLRDDPAPSTPLLPWDRAPAPD